MDSLQKIKWHMFRLKFEHEEIRIDKKIGGKALNKRIETEFASKGAKDTQSTDYRLLEPIFEKVTLSQNDKVVDIGCGQGRVLSYLITEKGFKGKLVGVELSEKIADFTKQRFQNFPQVEIINGNAVKSIPSDGTVFYLFNPFTGEVLRDFLSSFEKTIKHPATIIYTVPVHQSEFDNRRCFSLDETFSVERSYIKYNTLVNIYKYNPNF
ncbi:MAG TPA: methyltransferase domain-containing protein [Oscillospiraceae bacterium]|nr:methyltransferase domain-containing protein [Oscillospiraceae bacterium]